MAVFTSHRTNCELRMTEFMTLTRWSVRMSITDFDDFGVTGSTSPGQLRSVLFSSCVVNTLKTWHYPHLLLRAVLQLIEISYPPSP